MTARFVSLLIWAAALATAVAWGLPLFTSATPVPPGASVASAAPVPGGNLVRLLGEPPPMVAAEAEPVVVDSRFRLVGVVAPRLGQHGATARGLALISVDGKPARAVGVGRELEPGLRLLSVGHREAALGAGPGVVAVTLALPPLAEAQRGRPEDAAAQPVPGNVPGRLGGLRQLGMPGQIPGQIPGQMTGHMTGQMPGQFSNPVPVQVPNQIPMPVELPGQPLQAEPTNEGPAPQLR